MLHPKVLEPEAPLRPLDTVSVDDDEFWQRLASNAEIKQSSGLSIAARNEGFQHLMRAAAPRLRSKAAGTVGVDASTSASAAISALNKGVLSLGLGRARLDFASRSATDFWCRRL